MLLTATVIVDEKCGRKGIIIGVVVIRKKNSTPREQ